MTPTSTPGRTFKAHVSWMSYLAGSVGLAWSVSMLVIQAWGSVGMQTLLREFGAYMSPEEVSQFQHYAVRSGIASVAFGLLTAWFICESVRLALEGGRAEVRLDDSGLTVRDWRRRERRLAWGDIAGARVISFGGLCRPRPLVFSSVEGTRVVIPRMRDQEVLVSEVISNAALVDSLTTWYETRYSRRPSGG